MGTHRRIDAPSASAAVAALLLDRATSDRTPEFLAEIDALARVIDGLLTHSTATFTIRFTDEVAVLEVPVHDDADDTENPEQEASQPERKTITHSVAGAFDDHTAISFSDQYVMNGGRITWRGSV
jgi:hypothetical protein